MYLSFIANISFILLLLSGDVHLPLVLNLLNIKRLGVGYRRGMASPVAESFYVSDLTFRVIDVPHLADCVLICNHYQHCWSLNYIPQLKMCLLSKTVSREGDLKFWDPSLLKSQHMEMYGEDGPILSGTKVLSRGKAPALCGLNAFGFGNEIESRMRRIIDGFTPRPYDIPWVGTMLKNNRPYCSATLISKNPTDKQTYWGLVAKHCIYKDNEDEDETNINMEQFGFLFGLPDARFLAQQAVFRKAEKAHVHPDEGLRPKDVALIRFTKPVRFNGYINGLCLPDLVEEVKLHQTATCFACGWGATELSVLPPKAADLLQCIKTDIQRPDPRHQLNGDSNSVLRIKWRDSKIKGPYHGDSGGPIFCRIPENRRTFAFGLITGGTLTPGSSYITAARISYFMSWINGILRRRSSAAEGESEGTSQSCCMFPTAT